MATDPRAARMSEAELEDQVRKLCTDLRVFYYHLPDSRTVKAGFPDDVLIGPHGALFRENKTERGRIRPEQDVILGQMLAAGLDVAVWRPTDLLSGRIRQELLAISPLRGRVPGGIR